MHIVRFNGPICLRPLKPYHSRQNLFNEKLSIQLLLEAQQHKKYAQTTPLDDGVFLYYIIYLLLMKIDKLTDNWKNIFISITFKTNRIYRQQLSFLFFNSYEIISDSKFVKAFLKKKLFKL
jgi:hypothetical protein